MSAVEIQNVIAGAGFFFYDGANTYKTSSPGTTITRTGTGLVKIECNGANPQAATLPSTPLVVATVKTIPVVSIVGDGYFEVVSIGPQECVLQFKDGGGTDADLPFSFAWLNW